MKATMKAKDLRRLIESTKFTTDGSGICSRQALQYIKLDFTRDEAKAVSLNGFSVSVEYCSCASDEDFTVLIKPFKIANINNDSQAIIEVMNEICLFDVNGIITGFKQSNLPEPLDESKYLKPYSEKKPEYKAYYNCDLLLKALRGIATSEPDSKYNSKRMLRFEFYSGHAGMLIKTGKKNVRLVLPVRCEEEN